MLTNFFIFLHLINKITFIILIIFRGNLLRAVELFDQAIPLAKTEMEMAHLFSLRDAALAQATVAQQLGMPIAPVNM